MNAEHENRGSSATKAAAPSKTAAIPRIASMRANCLAVAAKWSSFTPDAITACASPATAS
jgi:hypothetical protein